MALTITWLILAVGGGVASFFYTTALVATQPASSQIPLFIEKAQKIAVTRRLKNLHFRCENLLKSDLTGVTHAFFYGICMDDDDVEKVAQLLKKFSTHYCKCELPAWRFRK